MCGVFTILKILMHLVERQSHEKAAVARLICNFNTLRSENSAQGCGGCEP